MSCCNISCQKCPFSSAKKWHFERPNLRKDSKNHAKHPPKWFIRHLVHAFSIFGRVSSQFLKIMFLEAFWNCFTLLKGQKLETARRMPQKSFFLQKWVAYIQDQIILKGKVILTTFWHFGTPYYVRLSRNLHVHYVRLSRNLYILCTFKQKLVHTLCTFKQKFAHTLCTFKQKFVRTLCTFKHFQTTKLFYKLSFCWSVPLWFWTPKTCFTLGLECFVHIYGNQNSFERW